MCMCVSVRAYLHAYLCVLRENVMCSLVLVKWDLQLFNTGDSKPEREREREREMFKLDIDTRSEQI